MPFKTGANKTKIVTRSHMLSRASGEQRVSMSSAMVSVGLVGWNEEALLTQIILVDKNSKHPVEEQ